MAHDANTDWQTAGKAHVAYGQEKPEWAALSLEAINRWGSGEITLMHAIGQALEAAYAAGEAGEYPEPPAPPVNRTIRRTRPAEVTEPEPTRTRLVRSRSIPQTRTIIRRSR